MTVDLLNARLVLLSDLADSHKKDFYIDVKIIQSWCARSRVRKTLLEDVLGREDLIALLAEMTRLEQLYNW